jgi:hypothetical protein
MKTTKMNHPNSGIRCIVNSCNYYMSGDHCSAEKIDVAPKNAANAQETDCTTFTPRA